MKDIHIGQMIQERMVARRMSKAEFARRLGVKQQNINRILASHDTDTHKLQIYSEILEFDFFSLYSDNYGHTAVANGDSSIAAINSPFSTADNAALQEKINYLEQILKEKERLIQYMLKNAENESVP